LFSAAQARCFAPPFASQIEAAGLSMTVKNGQFE